MLSCESIDSNLNVGVNSTSPVEKLNVVGVVKMPLHSLEMVLILMVSL